LSKAEKPAGGLSHLKGEVEYTARKGRGQSVTRLLLWASATTCVISCLSEPHRLALTVW